MHPISDKLDQDRLSNSDSIEKKALEDFLKTSEKYLTSNSWSISNNTGFNQNQSIKHKEGSNHRDNYS
ncbi:MAG: hypothetical protein ACN4GM_09870 [Gammaproteobacteria bacterium]